MEAIIGAVFEKERLLLIGPLVHVVAEFMVNRDEIDIANLQADFDAEIVLVVDVPGAGVADDVAVRGFGEQRPLPKGPGQGRESHGDEEVFRVLHHTAGIDRLRFQQFGQVVAAAFCRHTQQGINIAPFLGPGIAQ